MRIVRLRLRKVLAGGQDMSVTGLGAGLVAAADLGLPNDTVSSSARESIRSVLDDRSGEPEMLPFSAPADAPWQPPRRPKKIASVAGRPYRPFARR